MKFSRCLAFAFLVAAVFPARMNSQQISAAQPTAVPRLVNFSGKATDDRQKPITGVAGITFSIYKGQYEGAALWIETQNVQADNAGNFTAQLGATKTGGMPLDLFTSGEARWLGVRVNGGQEQPRILLLSVPYALKAADAETVGGLPASAFVLASEVRGQSASTRTSIAPVPTSESIPPPPASTVTTSGGILNALPLWTTATNVQSSAITQTGSGATAKIGINTAAPTTALDVHGGSVIRGTFVLPATGTSTASAGKVSQPENFVASSFSSATSTLVNQTFQWQATPTNNNTSNPGATLNLLYGQGATTPAQTGLRIGPKGIIGFAPGQTFPGMKNGTVTSVGLSAPASDFTISNSPVTTNGILALNWNVAPTSGATANAIVKRDASGGFSAGAISATQIGVSGTIVTGGLAASGTITAGAMGLGTSSPTERLDTGIDGNIVIKTDPGNDTTPDNAGYKLIGRDYFGDNHTWSILTAPVGGGFGVPANSLSVWEYPPASALGCCVERFTVLPVFNSDPASYQGRVTISGLGWLGVGTTHPDAVLDVAGDFGALFENGVEIAQDLTVEGCIYLSGGLLGGTCLSDARLKKNIEQFPPVLDRLVQLQPISYNWRTEEFPRRHLRTARTSGLIAEEVEKVFPEMVTVDKDGYKRVNYGELQFLMLQAIRELKAESDSLREKAKVQEQHRVAALGGDGVDERTELAQLRAEVALLAALVRSDHAP